MYFELVKYFIPIAAWIMRIYIKIKLQTATTEYQFLSRKWGARDLLEQGTVVIRLACKVHNSVHLGWNCKEWIMGTPSVNMGGLFL